MAHFFRLYLLISTTLILYQSVFGLDLSNLWMKEVHMVLKQYVLQNLFRSHIRQK